MFIFSYREKQVISQKHLDKCLKSLFNNKNVFQIPIYSVNLDFKILYGLFYSLTPLNIHY